MECNGGLLSGNWGLEKVWPAMTTWKRFEGPAKNLLGALQ